MLPGRYLVVAWVQDVMREYPLRLAGGESRYIELEDQSAYITVEQPSATVSDHSFPGIGYYSYQGPMDWNGSYRVHTYDSQEVHVYRRRSFVGTYPIGESVRVNPGTYRLIVNNTESEMTVEAGQSRTVHLGRIELVGFASTAEILIKTVWPTLPVGTSDWGRDNVFDNAYLPTDVGVNGFPGAYQATVYRVPVILFST